MKKIICVSVLAIIACTLASGQVQFGIALYGDFGFHLNESLVEMRQDELTYLDGIYTEYFDGGISTDWSSTFGSSASNFSFGGEIELRLTLFDTIIVEGAFGITRLPASDFDAEYDIVDLSYIQTVTDYLGGSNTSVNFVGYYIWPITNNFRIDLGFEAGYNFASLVYTYLNEVDYLSFQATDLTGGGLNLGLRILTELKLNGLCSFLIGLTGKYSQISNIKGTLVNNLTLQNSSVTYYEWDIKDPVYGTIHKWGLLTPNQRETAEDNPNISHLKQAVIDLTGLVLYLGFEFSF